VVTGHTRARHFANLSSYEMSLETAYFIAKLSTATTLIPFFLGLVRFRSMTTELKLLLILLAVSITCDMAALYHSELKIGPNYVGDAYRLAEFILLLILYYKAFNNPKLFKAFVVIALFYVLFLVANVLFIQQEKINTYTHIILACVFIVLAVLFFYKLMKDLPTLVVYQLPMFWINVGVLVYFAGNLFLWIVSHYLVTVLNDDFKIYWSFHNFLSMIKNILFAAGFYVSLKSPIKSL
jgi:hypothetical protein